MKKQAADGRNYVSEWFGHAAWPPENVDSSETAIANQTAQRCPFLSSATGREVLCDKLVTSEGESFRSGFCTQSGVSSGSRSDWLACPSRVFDEQFSLIRDAVRHLYMIPAHEEFEVVPITRFKEAEVRWMVHGAEVHRKRVFAFASNPPALGGEVDIPETARSSGSKVDVSIVEVVGVGTDDQPLLGKFAMFEVQTADFHGSPLHAIRELRRLGPPTVRDSYHDAFRANPTHLGTKLEGPNKANIFKRTIYQMILKMRMAKEPSCAGFCVVLPEPVWDSWSRHLADPVLVPDERDVSVLRFEWDALRQVASTGASAWIFVFKIDRDSPLSPRPLKVVKRIATTTEALLHYTFEVAPDWAVQEGALKAYKQSFSARFGRFWSDLAARKLK